MRYPLIAEVNVASKEQLAKWMRFLPSPGMHAIGRLEFGAACDAEGEVQAAISARFHHLGGWTPALSKLIGWR